MAESNANASPKLYFDDLAVGQRFVSGEYQVTEAEIIAFATQFDPQPFHTDVSKAKESFFGELVASGWHTASISMRLMVQGGLPLADGLIGAGGDIAWPNATKPNSTLRVESDVIELKSSRSHPERGIATIRSKTLNQANEVVQTLTAKLVVFRRKQTA